MGEFSHINSSGKVNMVDVTAKTETERTASATGEVLVTETIINQLKNNEIAKGDVFAAARIAGIQAAKKTYELIPLCHNILLTKINVDLVLDEKRKAVIINSLVKTVSKTGVEMEALTAVSVAALTIYDMCKAIDKGMVINSIRLLSKEGGKSGLYIAG